MKMSLEEAWNLKHEIDLTLLDYESYAKVVPAQDGKYVVHVVRLDLDMPEVPTTVKVVTEEVSDLADNDIDARNSSPHGKNIEPSLSPANTLVEPPAETRWRGREIQDIVKRVAMKPELQSRLTLVVASLTKLAFDRDSKIDSMFEQLRNDLIHYGYSPKSHICRALMKAHQTYDTAHFDKMLEILRKRGLSQSDKLYTDVKRIRNLVNKVPKIDSPRDKEKVRLTNQSQTDITGIQQNLTSVQRNLRRLGLKRESEQLKSLAAKLTEIYKKIRSLDK